MLSPAQHDILESLHGKFANSSQPQKPSLAGALATECAVAAMEPAEKR